MQNSWNIKIFFILKGGEENEKIVLKIGFGSF